MDGTILPKENTLFTPANNPRIGVIFQVGAAFGESTTDYAGKLANSFINGYVSAMSVYGNGSYNYGSGNTAKGYYNTQTIYAAITAGKGTNAVIMSAYQYEENVYHAPKGTSGWYIPAINQLSTIYGKRSALGIGWSMWTGSSTESGSKWYVIETGYGSYTTSKSNGAISIPILTF